MRIALVYDYINQYGGGERVLQTFLEMYPEADLFTLFYDEEKMAGQIPVERIKRVSDLNKPFIMKHHRWFIPLMPKAIEAMDLGEEYDLIISITAGYAKGIRYSKGRHICYCFTPLRYAWESERYLAGKFKRSYPLVKPVLKLLVNYLQKWDKRVGQRPDKMIAISNLVANRIEKYYDRLTPVIYPAVDTSVFYNSVPYSGRKYFLASGRMMHYKGFDLIVQAFNVLKLPLVIIGRGPELARLKKINITKTTKIIEKFKSDEEMREIYNNAKALIFPQVEDFGLVALEAIACGTPVIVYEQSGAREIIEEERNGLVIKKQTPPAIMEAVQNLENYSWNSLEIEDTAQRFNKERFVEEFKKVVG